MSIWILRQWRVELFPGCSTIKAVTEWNWSLCKRESLDGHHLTRHQHCDVTHSYLNSHKGTSSRQLHLVQWKHWWSLFICSVASVVVAEQRAKYSPVILLQENSSVWLSQAYFPPQQLHQRLVFHLTVRQHNRMGLSGCEKHFRCKVLDSNGALYSCKKEQLHTEVVC